MFKHVQLKACLLAGFLIFSNQLQATDLKDRQTELKRLQSQISKQQSSLQSTSKQREQLQALLKQDEQAVARVAQKANETRKALANVDKELAEIADRQVQLNKLRKSQQDTLSKQLASAYLAGNHDYTKMLLNQQNPATIERMLAYYQYLNQARIQAIDSLKATMEELTALAQKEHERKTRLNGLMLEQQQQADELSKEQIQREQTLAQLQRVLQDKGAQLEQLQIEEASLKRVLEQAEKAARQNASMDGLARSRGKLNWPVKGNVRHSFGGQRSGGVTWKGVILAAPEGREVKPVAPGKIIYADWLRGFGMVMVVDHGKGYMSLYGHAQALLKSVGEQVGPGDTIALVGRSGGQTEPGLYFEIRHKGQAINPANYCR
ncbi:murein hydrolase activator EnvC family protein [Shewanella sp. GXUN23E]|uniref:murein hydrolase activator EnvC family protein n=1 Tax=Shewanella sp. GXUN23E TaxID=3422498 RepID=UPI003D7EB060